MRMIDADALIDGRVENDPVRIAAMCAPTAYDVDKVVERLENEGNKIFKTHFPEEEWEFHDNGFAEGLWKAAEIVKAGGISNVD